MLYKKIRQNANYLCLKINFLLTVCLSFSPEILSAETAEPTETEEVEESPAVKQQDSYSGTEISVRFSDDENGETGEEEYNSGIDRLINTTALSNGLASGSSVLNRSIETLMEVIFYRLLDREIRIKVNEETDFKVGVQRDLFPAPTGAYVVVDRFFLGPDYLRKLGEIQSLPVNLGIKGKVDVLDIYLTTDGTRLAQENELPLWHSMINNMFGLVPILSLILPPSFNPNEMYDPFNLVKTPFSFPVSIGGFRTMPVGTIRSYDVSGGVNLPIDTAQRLPKNTRDDIRKADGLSAAIPFSVFVEGDFRINVLRRSKNIAWVGLTKTRRVGERVDADLGRKLKLLDKLILEKWWTGIPIKFSPVDTQLVSAHAFIFNQLYEFDLRRDQARRAYELAVKGDFVFAGELAVKQFTLAEDSGVTFHYNSNEEASESVRNSSSNLILLSNEIENSQSYSQIEITDEQGKFHILRAHSDLKSEFSEALTGQQRDFYRTEVELKVVKTGRKRSWYGKPENIYEFDSTSPNPIVLTVSQTIRDRYVDAHEYSLYIDRLREFSSLPLATVPKIPRRLNEAIEERKRTALLADPMRSHLLLNVTPTYLGRFESTATMAFDTTNLNYILSRSDDEKWFAFASVYGADASFWVDSSNRSFFSAMKGWITYFGALPLMLVGVLDAEADFYRETRRAIITLGELRDEVKPLEKLRLFNDLFSTYYPDKLARALYLLAKKNQVPRNVSINAKAKGSAPRKIKDLFGRLQNKVYRSLMAFPPLERSRLAEEKQNAFYPGELRERRIKPIISKIDVSMTLGTDAGSVDLSSATPRYVKVRIVAKNMSPGRSGKIYLRVGETGKIQLGKFLLGEKVFDVRPTMTFDKGNQAQLDALAYEFFLTGPNSPVRGRFFDSSVDQGGDFQIDVGLSGDGRVWSDERSFSFHYDKGVLTPVQ